MASGMTDARRAETRLATVEITERRLLPMTSAKRPEAALRSDRRLATGGGADRGRRAARRRSPRNHAIPKKDRPFAGGALADDLADGVARPGATRVAAGRPPREHALGG